MSIDAWSPQTGEAMPLMPPSVARTPPAIVWHYTDSAGLAGILAHRELWASAPFALNDSSEVLYGSEMLRAVWDACDKSGLTASQRQAMEFLVDGLEERALERVFVASACEEGDLLNQWAHYAGGKGFAIGLDTSVDTPALRGTTKVDASTWSSWVKVVYERDVQVERMKEAVTFALQWMPKEVKTGTVNRFSLSTLQEFALVHVMLTVKHPAFSAEREVRFVTSSFADQRPLLRSSGSRLIPYVRVDQLAIGTDTPRSSAIKYVRLGPGATDADKRAIESLYRRPKQALAPKPEIFRSEIPYMAQR